MAKKNTTGDYRKHFHNDYKTGRLSYEDPLTQWAHIMVLDEMFELQKRNECLLYKHAVKRYGKKEVDKLIEESFFLKKKSNFNNEECIYCDQIDNNIVEITELSKKKREAANVKWHNNKEGKKDDPVKELAKYLKVSQQTIINWSSRDILNPLYIQGRVFYKAEDIEKLLN